MPTAAPSSAASAIAQYLQQSVTFFHRGTRGADAAHGELGGEEEVGGGGGVEGVQRDLQQSVTVCCRSNVLQFVIAAKCYSLSPQQSVTAYLRIKVLQFVIAGRACGSTRAAEPWPSTMMPRMDALVASM